MESVQEIPQERLPVRIEEPNKNTLIPHRISSSAPAPVIENISPESDVSCATPVPPIEHVAPALVIEHVEPAPELQLDEMFGKSCAVIRIGTGPHFIGQIRISTGKSVDGSSRALGCDATTSLPTSTMPSAGGFSTRWHDRLQSDDIHMLKCIRVCTLCSY